MSILYLKKIKNKEHPDIGQGNYLKIQKIAQFKLI